jgi:hypothetical protein
MAETTVDHALADYSREDSTAADAARTAFEWLTAGEGLDVVTAHGLADFLWYQLPVKWDGDVPEKVFIANSLGELFRRLDRPRYQAMCTSSATEEVLTAYEFDGRSAALKAYKAALEATGVRPPDIPGMVDWSSVMGSDENDAYWSTSSVLEEAVESGELRPGAPGWRKTAIKIAGQFLQSPHDDLTGATWLQWMLAERLEHWSDSRSLTRGRLARSIVDRLTNPLDAPADAAKRLAPIQWLLDHAFAGAPLTQAGYLSPAIVAEGTKMFEWLLFTKKPRSEADITELWTLRQWVQELKAVRRVRRQLLLSTVGKTLQSGGPEQLWDAVTASLPGVDEAGAAAAEICLLYLLESGPLDYARMNELVAETLGEQGWRSERTGAMTPEHASSLLAPFRRRLDLLGLAKPRKIGEPLVLTDSGRVAAHSALRARATSARHDIYGG